MTILIFESHSTSCDNEKGIASGILDCPLSPLGKQQAEQLGKRYRENEIDVVYCSDLARSYETAKIAFQGRGVPIIQDSHLREWDYGQYNGQPSDIVEKLKPKYVYESFPGGESLSETVERIGEFLRVFTREHLDKSQLFIGHRAGYYACEHYFHHVLLEEIVARPWKWQPGWRYSGDFNQVRHEETRWTK